MRRIIVTALVLVCASHAFAGAHLDLDRTGSVYLSPKFAYAIPMGAMADENYNDPASSWRKDGFSLTLEAGCYLSNTSIAGLELSYSTFSPKRLSILAAAGQKDKSRMRIRRASVFYQYQVVPTGKYRPFIKVGVGIFDANRWSMPQPGNDPVTVGDYTLGGQPAFSAGIGFVSDLTPTLSASFSIEGIYLNSCRSSWQTAGANTGPLNQNLLFVPVYFSILYHLQ